jgi:hypothetical protein
MIFLHSCPGSCGWCQETLPQAEGSRALFGIDSKSGLLDEALMVAGINQHAGEQFVKL